MKLKIFGLLIVALAMAACNAVENKSTSATMLEIVSLTDSENKIPIFSAANDPINDLCLVTVKALPLDPQLDEKTTSPYFNVVIDLVSVKFMRTDGRNVEGVDVPYNFTQPMSWLVPIFGELQFPINIIRHVAKREPPLLALGDGLLGKEKNLQLVAEVTIHGKDLGGHRVAPIIGYVSVWTYFKSTTE